VMSLSLWRRTGLTGFLGMVKRSSDGRNNRTSHSWMVCLDVTPSPSKIPVLPVEDRVPAGSGVWCILYDDGQCDIILWKTWGEMCS
jgi:hypothetical protein